MWEKETAYTLCNRILSINQAVLITVVLQQLQIEFSLPSNNSKRKTSPLLIWEDGIKAGYTSIFVVVES